MPNGWLQVFMPLSLSTLYWHSLVHLTHIYVASQIALNLFPCLKNVVPIDLLAQINLVNLERAKQRTDVRAFSEKHAIAREAWEFHSETRRTSISTRRL